MILSELNKLLVNIANSNFLVHQAFVGDVYTINAKENRFGCFVATPMTAVKSGIGTIRYTYVLYYIDRLTKDEANIDFVQTDAVNLLKGVIEFLGENDVEIEDSYEFTLFRQKFDDWCAGAYVSVNILVPDNDCTEGIFNTGGVDLRPLVVDSNGIYEPGSFDGYNQVTVDVPQVGATEEWVDQEIDLKLTGYATQSWVSAQGYLTEHQDLSSYATKSYVNGQIDIVRGEIPSLDGYATQTWVQNQGYLNSIPAGYATEIWVENHGYLTSIPADYATKNWVENQGYLTSVILSGYATETWVQNQGYLTSVILSGYATESWVSSQQFATETWVSSQGYLTSVVLSGYATESWVQSQGYLTSVPSEYATQSWVSNQGYLTSVPSEYATKSWCTSEFFEESKIWTGNTSQWESLTSEQQALYTIALITE